MGSGFNDEEDLAPEELGKLIKKYKKMHKYRKSSIFAVKNMDNTEKIAREVVEEFKKQYKK